MGDFKETQKYTNFNWPFNTNQDGPLLKYEQGNSNCTENNNVSPF